MSPRAFLDPAKLGPYLSCEDTYTFSKFLFGAKITYFGKLYVPGLKLFNSCVTGLQCPLVVISHLDSSLGRPLHNDYLEYDLLGRQLASHGYIVASVSRYYQLNGGPLQQPGNPDEWFIYDQHLSWLYNFSSIKNALTDDIAIIGHSGGGSGVSSHLSTFSKTKNVRDLILFAPAGVSLSGAIDHCNGFLGINVTHDTDSNAKGPEWTVEPLKPNIAITAFDHIKNNVTNRDYIFFGVASHAFQDKPEIRAYVTAHLGLHLRGDQSYRDIFRRQTLPGSLTPPQYLIQGHSEPGNKVVLADFNVGDPVFETIGSISGIIVDLSWKINTTSMSDTRVLWFRWTKSFLPTHVRFKIPLTDISTFKLLAFRMCQCYDRVRGNVAGITRNVEVLLDTTRRVVRLAKAPIPFTFVDAGLQAGFLLKSVLSTITIDLSEIVATLKPDERLRGVWFDFGNNGPGSSYFMLGEIELWH